MADIYARVRELERKVNFLMNTVRMNAAVSSGLSGPDGRPLPGKTFNASLAELYQMTKQLPTLAEDSGAIPPPVEDSING